jgi:hypothetical protein
VTVHAALANSITWGGWKWTSYIALGLIAATANVLNGALLARRPAHSRNYPEVGS